MTSASDNCAFYHQTKTPIDFYYKRGLNPISLIQQSKILPVELIRTHNAYAIKSYTHTHIYI